MTPPKEKGYRYPKEGAVITEAMEVYNEVEKKWLSPSVSIGMTIDKDSVGRYRIPKK